MWNILLLPEVGKIPGMAYTYLVSMEGSAISAIMLEIDEP
jgi:hypothetical protein